MQLTGCWRVAAFCASAIFYAQTSWGQACQVPGTLVGGTYAFTAIGTGVTGALLSATSTSSSGSTTTSGTGTTSTGSGTTTTSATTASSLGYSNTELGLLLGGIAVTSSPFSASGTLFLEGAGNVYASMVPGGTSTLVGSYTLNPDCTVTMMLRDTFGTNTTSTTLQGIVLNSGSEIDLSAVPSSTSSTGTTGTTGTSGNTGTTGTSTTSTGTTTPVYESSVLVTLTRASSTACTVADLSGPYALVGTGTNVATVTSSSGTTTQTEAPFYFLALVDFNGAGGVISPTSYPLSTLNDLRFTGTYTLNQDCSGTMTLTSVATSSASSSTSATGSLSLNLIVNLATVPIRIEFSQSTGSQILTGYGIMQ